jgi:TP901 family phage tail tape measure protein
MRITYTGDARGVLGALKTVENAHKSFGDNLRVVGQKLQSAGRGLTMGLTLPIVGIGVAAVSMAKEFEESMNTMQAVGGVTGKELKKLEALAIDLGAKTAFSANEAAEAMLELSKSGIKTSDIMGGALKNTLDLATAGGLDLATAATVAGNAMNVFGLSGKESKQAVDALAGAANASSANVSDLAIALAQGGLAAANAGLSIEETTAVLAAFADAGLRGSDAGTSLKTFLLNLVPTSVAAANAIADLNLKFVDQAGNIKPISAIAEELQTKMGDLTQAEQQLALKTIFGTDAFRAAVVLMKEGEEGLRKYIAATSEGGTASEVAAAKMKGLPGAIETLRGALETVALTLGKALSPMVQQAAAFFTDLASKFTDLSPATQRLVVIFGLVAAAIGPVLWVLGALATGLGVLLSPIGLIIAALVLLGAGFALAWNRSEEFRDGVRGAIAIVQGVIEAFVAAVGAFWDEYGKDIMMTMRSAQQAIKNFVDIVSALWDRFGGIIMDQVRVVWNFFVHQVEAAFRIVKGIFDVVLGILTLNWKQTWHGIREILGGVWDSIKNIVHTAFDALKNIVRAGLGIVAEIWKGVWDKIKGVVLAVVNAILGFIENMIDKIQEAIGWLGKLIGLGGDVSGQPGGRSSITGFRGPELQHGGVVTRTGLAMVHAGEVYSGVGAGRMGGNIYATIHVSGAVDPEATGRKVYEYILKLQRRNGTSGIV